MEQWVFYVVLTMSYCMAPEGKTVCEAKEDYYRFTGASHCERARRDLTLLYDKYYSNIILYKDKSTCQPLVKEVGDLENTFFDSYTDALNEALEQIRLAQLFIESEW